MTRCLWFSLSCLLVWSLNGSVLAAGIQARSVSFRLYFRLARKKNRAYKETPQQFIIQFESSSHVGFFLVRFLSLDEDRVLVKASMMQALWYVQNDMLGMSLISSRRRGGSVVIACKDGVRATFFSCFFFSFMAECSEKTILTPNFISTRYDWHRPIAKNISNVQHRMNCDVFSDPLTLHRGPSSSGRNLNLSNTKLMTFPSAVFRVQLLAC